MNLTPVYATYGMIRLSFLLKMLPFLYKGSDAINNNLMVIRK